MDDVGVPLYTIHLHLGVYTKGPSHSLTDIVLYCFILWCSMFLCVIYLAVNRGSGLERFGIHIPNIKSPFHREPFGATNRVPDHLILVLFVTNYYIAIVLITFSINHHLHTNPQLFIINSNIFINPLPTHLPKIGDAMHHCAATHCISPGL